MTCHLGLVFMIWSKSKHRGRTVDAKQYHVLLGVEELWRDMNITVPCGPEHRSLLQHPVVRLPRLRPPGSSHRMVPLIVNTTCHRTDLSPLFDSSYTNNMQTMTSIPPNPLRRVTLPEIHSIQLPAKKILNEEDVEIWLRTQGFRDLIIFLRRLNEAVVGVTVPWSSELPSQAVLSMVTLIDTLDSWIEEIPPLISPQRFGNLAFRTWGARLEEVSSSLAYHE
ncbi:hypothetical protein HHX47_DHR7000444 [Lentinula edodes]|nr:hypothetical protein HHX47_DHR7000444 [Lentinula edodes]